MKRKWSICPDSLRKPRTFKNVLKNPFSNFPFLDNYFSRAHCIWFIWVRRKNDDRIKNCRGCDLVTASGCNVVCKHYASECVCKRVKANDILITEDGIRFVLRKTDDVKIEPFLEK